MVKARSMTLNAIRKRIDSLPELLSTTVENVAKRRAELLVENFHDGIIGDKFGLYQLEPDTVARKDALGMQSPDTPLYGLGDDAEDTYANMLEARRDGPGKRYVVGARDAYHQVLRPDGTVARSRLKLAKLLAIHEHGCTIMNGFGRGITIRLKPRPALRCAYRKTMAQLKREEPAAEVRSAIARLVKSGDDSAMREIARRAR
jgi:hypothetical protein